MRKDFKVLISVLRSIARRLLVKTENPSACATLNWKVCKSAIALYLSVIKRTCNQGANKSNHKYNPQLFARHTTLHMTIYIRIINCHNEPCIRHLALF
jgi:hypothetical protein